MKCFTTSDGVEIHYRCEGAGEALLLLHGLGSAADDWQAQIDYYQARYCVIAPDLRGHGRSGVNGKDYSMQRFARDVNELLDHLGIERVTIIGLSMGGAVAFQTALDQPARVRQLLIVNSGPSAKAKTLEHKFYISLRRLLAFLFKPSFFAKSIADRLFPASAMQPLREQFIERISANNWRSYRKSIEALSRWCVEDQLHRFTMPVAFICAEFDYTPVEFKQYFAERLPDAVVKVVADTHHALPVEAPAAFHQAVDDCLI